jgi:hydroxyacylglutathione hydrolase
MVQIIPISAFQDNYIWLLHQNGHAIVVDPGDSVPVHHFLKDHNLNLDAILITHHHSDHIDGVENLLNVYPAMVYAPAKEHYHFPHTSVSESTDIHIPTLNLNFQVLEVPGHTLDHVVYYGSNYLFCGDTLFGAGCGRLFEGTPEQMYQSLQRLAVLPSNTEVYCTHEYTVRNIEFALTLEPNNQMLLTRAQHSREQRLQNKPTLPSTIGLELATNPFLRCAVAEIQSSSKTNSSLPISIFSAIRQMRNQF